MFRTVLIAALITVLNQNVTAHKCILNGSSATEITVYNSCKNDLASGADGHSNAKELDRIKELEQENGKLKGKILTLKRYLSDLLRFIE